MATVTKAGTVTEPKVYVIVNLLFLLDDHQHVPPFIFHQQQRLIMKHAENQKRQRREQGAEVK